MRSDQVICPPIRKTRLVATYDGRLGAAVTENRVKQARTEMPLRLVCAADSLEDPGQLIEHERERKWPAVGLGAGSGLAQLEHNVFG